MNTTCNVIPFPSPYCRKPGECTPKARILHFPAREASARPKRLREILAKTLGR